MTASNPSAARLRSATRRSAHAVAAATRRHRRLFGGASARSGPSPWPPDAIEDAAPPRAQVAAALHAPHRAGRRPDVLMPTREEQHLAALTPGEAKRLPSERHLIFLAGRDRTGREIAGRVCTPGTHLGRRRNRMPQPRRDGGSGAGSAARTGAGLASRYGVDSSTVSTSSTGVPKKCQFGPPGPE